MENIIQLKNFIKGNYGYEEALKTLRTNIQFCGSNIKVIMFSSAVPNEGKTDLSFALSASLAQIGKKVLFIDADIRKSVIISRYQPDKNVAGLSQLLSGQKQKQEVIYKTNIDNLDMIFSGPYSPNPAELLEEFMFSALIESARMEYDFVVIDTPPLMDLIDGAIIAPHCDGAVVVIESGIVSYRIEQKIKKQLEITECRILGVILNKVNVSDSRYKNKYYSKYGKSKKYERYGQELRVN